MRRRTSLGVLGTAGLIAAAVFAPLSANANIGGPIVAGADADLVELSGVSIPPGCGEEAAELFGLEAGIDCTFQVGTLRVGDSETGDSSASDLSNGIEDGLASFGHGSNTDVEALTSEGVDGAIAQDLVVQADAYLPGGPAEDFQQVGEAPENPLIGGDLFTSEASATDISEGNTECPTDDEIRLSHGRNETLNLALLPGQLPEGGDLLSTEGVSYALSQVDLVDSLVGGTGDGAYGVRSTAEVDLATATLLDGNIVLELVQPRLVATHDGQELSVEYTAPDVVLTAGGEEILDGTILDQLDANIIDPLLEALEPITSEIEPVLKVNLDIKQAEDVEIAGNTATVSDVVFLSIELLNAIDEEAGGIEVASLSIGDLSVTAEVPEGGAIIECGLPPITVDKDGPATVAPGETFDYTIDITNETGCDLTDVVVTDTITGPDGFEITGTDPEADTVDGGVATWEVGDLADGETQTFTVTIQVPDDATDGDEFLDVATADGNCDDQALPRGEDTLEGPRVEEPAGGQALPRTGGGLALLGLGAVAAASRLRRRR